MLDFTRDDYGPTEREAHQAEDEADLAPETEAYRNWALAEAVEGPPDDDDYPDDYSASCAAEDASIEARDETQDPASDISAAETFYRSTWREKHLSRAGPI